MGRRGVESYAPALPAVALSAPGDRKPGGGKARRTVSFADDLVEVIAFAPLPGARFHKHRLAERTAPARRRAHSASRCVTAQAAALRNAMEMARSVGQRVTFGVPVVWHTSGEVDVFVPYDDGRWHADPHLDENPMRMPRCHAIDDLTVAPGKYLHMGPAIPKTKPFDGVNDLYDEQALSWDRHCPRRRALLSPLASPSG